MFSTRQQTYLNRVDQGSISLFFSGKAPQKSADQFYPFSVNKHFFYLTGIDQANTVLMLVKGIEPAVYLFMEPVDPIKALWEGAGLTFEEASKQSGIDLKNIRDLSTLDQTLAQLLSTTRRAIHGPIQSLYLDLERLTEKTDDTEGLRYAERVRHLFPHVTLKTSQLIMAEVRTVKDDHEVSMIRQAIAITKEGLEHVLETLKPDVYEYQVEASYNFVLNLNRTTPAFETIAASGKNATILHYVKNDAQIEDGQLVLFDLGVCLDHYNSDITRTYPSNGMFTERQKAIYEIVLEANKKTIQWLKAGVTIKEFNDYGKAILIEGAKSLGLIKEDDEITKYYYHSLGHYLGLDVHDVGNYALPIPEGAILTVEPGLYIAEEGIGIRIEDDVLVTKDGCVNLSKDIPKEVDEIEAFMKAR